MTIPSGHQTVMPYLIVKDAARFSEFIQRVFNAEEKMRHMRDEKFIMHAEIIVGGCTIMFADATEQFQERTTGLFVYVENADETFQKALDEGAASLMPPADQPYGRSGGVTDPFGNTWWITTPL
ncbi:MAG: VOC family protein [Chitinophagaceae bacterium]